MVRRRAQEVEENHERWVISYADFITLLFAFFVVMYSISSVNEGKYKVLSDSLVSVFNAQPKTLEPTTVGDKDVRKSNDQLIKLPVPGDYSSRDDYKYSVEGVFDDVETKAVQQGELKDNEVDRLSKLSDQLAFSLQQQLDAGEVEIRSSDDWIEINIKASVLYSSGSSELSESAKEVLQKVAVLLKDKPNPVHVEGYTDNIPIETVRYPSNWELSAARAASVVRYFQQSELNPERLAAVGYGEFHPVADNETEEGRAKNRRMALVISRAEPKPEPQQQQINPDYKLGDPDQSKKQQPIDRRANRSPVETPLRILKLSDGGLLFSADGEPRK